MKKQMIFLILLVSCMTVTVFAREIPDLTRRGSLEVNPGVTGGTLTIYRVGEILEEDGNYSFIPTGDFADCGLGMEDVSSSDLAAELERYVVAHSLTGETQEIEDAVVFDELEAGLYLIVQQTAAPGYGRIAPFLVAIPMLENGVYSYDVDATPKMGTVPETDPTATKPEKPVDPTLPQTGQLNWPVAVLSVLGIGLTAAGWSMRKREQ